MMKRRPTGFVATCRCGIVIGAMDFERTDRKEAGRILGEWLYSGCSVDPRFGNAWSDTVKPCGCKASDQP